MATVVLVLFLCLFRDKPPTPPSLANIQTSSTEQDVSGNIKKVLRNENALILIILFGLVQGVGISVATIIGVVCQQIGFTDEQASLLGVASIVGSFVLTCIFGAIVEAKKNYK